MEPHTRPCGLLRRLAIILYDTLLLGALLLLASALALPVVGDEPARAGHPLFKLYLAVISFLYFGWFWTAGRRTLGMQSWRVRIRRLDGRPPTWDQALRRYLVAPLSWTALGLGFLWALFDPHRRTWHDLASGTVLVVLPKPQKTL